MARAADPLRAFARMIPAATRAALEECFWYWFRNVAPEHFERDSFGRFREYDESAKRDRQEWVRRHAAQIARAKKSGIRLEEAQPLRVSGRLRTAFLRGPVTFSGGNRRLTAKWPGLPRYATYTNRYSGFQPAKALVAMNEADQVSLTRLFRDWLNRNLLTGDIAAKTFGGGLAQGD